MNKNTEGDAPTNRRIPTRVVLMDDDEAAAFVAQATADIRRATLDAISENTRSLRRALLSIQQDATDALAAIDAGKTVRGAGLGYGPIGHQAPFDVAQLTDRINSAVTTAYRLGCSAEEINAAYTKPAR